MDPNSEAALSLLNHLTTEELRSLIDNDERISEMIADLPQVKIINQEREMLLASNKSLAEHNLSLEPKLSEGKRSLIAAYEDASTLSDSLSIMKASIDSTSGQYKPDTIQALLQTAAHEKEEETEKLIQAMLEKNLSVEEFLVEFINKRSIAHTRRIKADKVAEMIRRGNFGSSGVPNTTTAASKQSGPGYPQLPYPSLGQPLPYPTNFNMPMPGF